MILGLRTVPVALVAAATLAAQEPGAVRTLELRVVSAPAPGRVTIDRGRVDKLLVGDDVVLRPRQGGTYPGRIVEVGDRTSLVELRDREFSPAPGTRGDAILPAARFAVTPTAGPASRPVGTPTTTSRPNTTASPEHPPWRNQDQGYTKDQPLLGTARAVRPEERPLVWSLRTYAFGDLVKHPESDWDESFLRLGGDLRIDNPFGAGGAIRLNAELDRRDEYDGSRGASGLVRTLSYAWGGTRFDENRYEAGRFLQHDMPEFGTLDGFQWTRRLANGNRFGASLGFMPRPDDRFDGTQDFQLAAYHVWQLDALATDQLSAGFQQSLHSGDLDRSLLVLKGHHLPPEQWNFDGTLWIDLYDGADDVRGPGVGLTQALATARRASRDGDEVTFAWRHLEFPDLLRKEFLPLTPENLDRDRKDQLSVEGWLQSGSPHLRWRGYLAGWNDEGHTGGALELGGERRDWFVAGSRTSFDVFADTAEFAAIVGARGSVSAEVTDGRWDLFYEISRHHITGAASDRDDLMQHRVRAARTFYRLGGCELELHAQMQVWGDDLAWDLGFTFQKKFGSVHP